MLGVFYVQRKDMPSDGTVCKTFLWEAPAGCRGSRNKMLSPRKGIPWAWHGQGTDSRHQQQDIIFFQYIPQFLPKGLRTFFVRHISIIFPYRLQNGTMILRQTHLEFFRCAFFALLAAGISRRSEAVRRRFSLETV